MKTIAKDNSTGMPLLNCELPSGFKANGQLSYRQYPENRSCYIEISFVKDNCSIVYKTGENYLYEKIRINMAPNNGPQNPSGAWFATPTSLKDDLDKFASSIVNKKIEAKDYYDLSKNMKSKAKKDFDKQLIQFKEELQFGASISSIPIGIVFRNYLLDGGMGIYENEGKIIAVSLYRIGFEVDFVSGYGFMENLTGEPFGQASTNMNTMASNASWTIPSISYMVSDDKKDLKTFMEFVDSQEYSQELINYIDQNRVEVLNYQQQKAQMEAMQNQAMWNMVFAQQQQQFAAMDRMTNMIHQDLDNFHNNLNTQMAQNDMHFNLGGNNIESMDDRIQRMRHESIMGVETYERNDGSTVEYSSMADRVFENNLDSTTHFGTHHYYDDYVPEGWHEMKKK